MRDLGDLGDRDRALRPQHGAVGAAHRSNIALQRCAPIRHSLSRNIRLARATAPPDITMLREAKVPKPKAVLSVSPWRTEIRAGSMPAS